MVGLPSSEPPLAPMMIAPPYQYARRSFSSSFRSQPIQQQMNLYYPPLEYNDGYSENLNTGGYSLYDYTETNRQYIQKEDTSNYNVLYTSFLQQREKFRRNNFKKSTEMKFR